MSASYYTSYTTSVALREAGAPQGPQKPNEPIVCSSQLRICWNRDGEEKPWLGEWIGDDFSVRSWRLDEILEALDGHLWQIGQEDNHDYICGAELPNGEWFCASSPPTLPWSPVEAAAQVWLAVLRAKGKEE